MRKFLLSLAALVLLLPTLGLAADIRTAEVVTKEETPKNLYLAGQNPTVDANVTGDLVVAGGVVTVNGDVQNDVLAAGSTLNLNGKVANNVRVAGGTVNIESNIGGDLVIFGGDVILGTKSVISGDVLVFAGTVNLKGVVNGSVKKGYAGSVLISGKVGGDVELANVGALTMDSNANVVGNLRYSSKNEASVSSDAKVGGKVEFTKITTASNWRNFTPNLGSVLFGILMAFITILVFIKLFPKFANRVVNAAVVNPLAKMGIGFAAMVGTPIALLLLLLTIFGWGVMAYLGVAYAAFLILTGSLSAILVGSLVWKYLRKEKNLEINWKTVAIGVVLTVALKLIPIIGWLAVFAIALVVFGTLTTMGWEYIKTQRA